MKRLLLPVTLAIACGFAAAKLPPPDAATKAKAAETAAKAAWQAKVDGYQLCKVQDRVAAHYKANAGKQPKPAPAGSATPVATAAAPQAGASAAAAPAAAATPAAAAPAAGTPVAAAPAAAAGATGTPVAAVPLPPCLEPGPFAYNPPEEKPLEAAGAHSPTGTAATPPSVLPNAGQMPAATPTKKP